MLKIAWSSAYNLSLPANHRFPMIKYDLIPEQLLYEGTITKQNLFAPEPQDHQWIVATHSATYFQKLLTLNLTKSEILKTGFPLTKELVERELIIANGTLQCCLYALKYGVSLNVAGGTHHAFYDRGEGFCLLNDIAISANYLLQKGIRKRILVVDLDVHQGNGTAALFQQEVRVFTFSMHCGKNYPMQKEKSDLDVELEHGMKDREYLRILQNELNRVHIEFIPDFIIYQSGVDVLEDDKLGKLHLSLDGCKERDRIVLSFANENGLPIAVCMGGGYSKRLSRIVDAHANTFRLAQEMFF